jgi:predicted porin
MTGPSRGAVAAAIVMALAGSARASILLYDRDGWTLSIGGRTQGFYSFATGDSFPRGEAAILGGEEPVGAVGDEHDRFTTSRLRGGWAANMFGLTVTNQISEGLKATGRVSFWFTIEGDQTKGLANDDGSLDIRQGFVKLEGRWGGVLFGRSLALHSRGSLLQDSFITADEYSVGSPCSITGLGITCGQVGYGVLMPGFNAGIVYNTPEWRGFGLSVGAYDPRRIGPDDPGPQSYGQTPYPRLEAEATERWQRAWFSVDLFANGMWQQAGKTGGSDTIDAYGVGYGGRVGLGGLTLGFAGGWDHGGGMYVPLGDVAIDAEGHLRNVVTWWAQAMYALGPVAVTGGVGQARMHATTVDQADPMFSLIKSHLGINGAVLWHLGPVVLVAQYFRMVHTWYRGQEQAINLVNTGATFNW